MKWIAAAGAAVGVAAAIFGGGLRDALWRFAAGFAAAFLAICVLLWLFLAITGLFIDRKKEYRTFPDFYFTLLNVGYRFICDGARVRLHVSGMEKLPGENFLLVSNHRSRFDNMLQSVALGRRRIAYLSKPENFRIPIGRRYIHRCGYLAIDRENPRNALVTIHRAAEQISQVSMGVFPEGHRGNGAELLPFRPGCLKIALLADCPIVVVVMRGTEKIHLNFPWRRTDVHMDIVGVIEPAGRKTAELSAQIREMMEGALAPERENTYDNDPV